MNEHIAKLYEEWNLPPYTEEELLEATKQPLNPWLSTKMDTVIEKVLNPTDERTHL